MAKRLTRGDWLWACAVVLVATLLRVGLPGIVEYKMDEAQLSLRALEMARTGVVPLTGILSSVGVPNPPVSVYIMALPYRFTDDPLIATLFVAALNIIGVALVWAIARRYAGGVAAFAAGMAYAVNPYAILYSRKIWAQNLHSPLVLLAVWLGLLGFVEGRRWAQALCLPVLVVAVQHHFAAFALLPLYAVFLWQGRRRISLRAFGVSAALALVAVLPFAIGYTQFRAQNPGQARTVEGFNLLGSPLDAEALRLTAEMATGLRVETQMALDRHAALAADVPQWTAGWALLGVVALLGVLASWRWRGGVLAPVLWAWALLPVLLFATDWVLIYPHYFTANLPVFALLIGVGAAWAVRVLPFKPLSTWLVLLVFGAVFASQAVWWRGALGWVDATYVTEGDLRGFDMPLAQRLPLRDALRAYDDVVLMAREPRFLWDQEAPIWTTMLYDSARCVRAVPPADLYILPRSAFAAVISYNVAGTPKPNLYQRGVGLPYAVSLDRGYTLYAYNTLPEMGGDPFMPVSSARFAHGAQLTGYRMVGDEVALMWSLDLPARVDAQYYVHVLDASGDKLAQVDLPFVEARYWCAGDRVVTVSAPDRLDAAAALRIGMYTFTPSGYVNIPTVNGDGVPVGTWVDLPLSVLR